MTRCWDRHLPLPPDSSLPPEGEGAGGEKEEESWKQEFMKLLFQEPQGEAKWARLGLRSLLASDMGLRCCSQLGYGLCPTRSTPALGK